MNKVNSLNVCSPVFQYQNKKKSCSTHIYANASHHLTEKFQVFSMSIKTCLYTQQTKPTQTVGKHTQTVLHITAISFFSYDVLCSFDIKNTKNLINPVQR